MLPTDVLLDWKGRVVEDLYGYRIGRIVDVQSKPETDVPEWGCITFGRLSLRRRFVPLADAELLAGQVRVPYQGDGEGRTDLATTGWLPPAATLALRDYYWLGEEPPP